MKTRTPAPAVPAVCFLAALAALSVLVAPPAPAQGAALPVVYLRYEGGRGVEMAEPGEAEEEELEASSIRNKVTLRIKEEWSEAVTTNLYSSVSRKEYLLETGSYLYFSLNPDLAWRLNENLTWRTSLRAKWVWYDEPYIDGALAGESRDLASLSARTELAMKLPGGVKLTPSLQSMFDLYRTELKSAQMHTAGLGLETRLGPAWTVSGRLRGILDLPLGEASAADQRLNYEFALNASWDPNRY